MQHTATNSNTAIVYRALRTFANAMQRTATPPDGILSARVVGEFSAGKTRLLRELLGELIPPPLFPVSSLECQTRLPLEITFAPTAALTLMERANDYTSAIPIDTLTQFPVREELTAYDPLRYRLQLTVPDTHLFLADGDHYEEDDSGPKRLLLIDMPGWNSGDDALAESSAMELMTGYHNLALVFIVNANRLDGSTNDEHLRDFLAALNDAIFVGTPTLLIVITHCPAADQHRLSERLRERVLTVWRDELDADADQLQLHLLPVEFGTLTADELAHFRATFWEYLLAPITTHAASSETVNSVAHSWLAVMNRWPADWDIRPSIQQAQTLLDEARALLTRARSENEYLLGMNMHRLLGLDAAAIQDKLRTHWLRQLQCQHAEQIFTRLTAPSVLPDEHPLINWWREYWAANLEQTLELIRQFFQYADAAFGQIQPDTPDLSAYLATQLDTAYYAAQRALDSSFTCLVTTAQALTNEPQLARATATLLSLSLLEARYADHYRLARCGLQ